MAAYVRSIFNRVLGDGDRDRLPTSAADLPDAASAVMTHANDGKPVAVVEVSNIDPRSSSHGIIIAGIDDNVRFLIRNAGGIAPPLVGANYVPWIRLGEYTQRFAATRADAFSIQHRPGERTVPIVDAEWQTLVRRLRDRIDGESSIPPGVTFDHWQRYTPEQKRDIQVFRRAYEDGKHEWRQKPDVTVSAMFELSSVRRTQRGERRSMDEQYACLVSHNGAGVLDAIVAVVAAEFYYADSNVDCALEFGVAVRKTGSDDVIEYGSQHSVVLPHEAESLGGVGFWSGGDVDLSNGLVEFLSARSCGTRTLDPLSMHPLSMTSHYHDPFTWLVIDHYFGVSGESLMNDVDSTDKHAACGPECIITLKESLLLPFFEFLNQLEQRRARVMRAYDDVDRRVAKHGGGSIVEMIANMRTGDTFAMKLSQKCVVAAVRVIAEKQAEVYAATTVCRIGDLGCYARAMSGGAGESWNDAVLGGQAPQQSIVDGTRQYAAHMRVSINYYCKFLRLPDEPPTIVENLQAETASAPVLANGDMHHA